MKIFKSTALLFLLVILFSACGKESGSSSGAVQDQGTGNTGNQSSVQNTGTKPEFVPAGKNGSRTGDKVGFQFDKPEKGEEIAVITTSKGVIKLRIFDESAPIAAKSFKLLITEQAYDGSTFHRIIDEFMIQGGKTAAGTDAWGGSFRYEYNNNLRHFRGALAMAHSPAPDSNGSEFYIVQNSKADANSLSSFSKDTVTLYKKHGGTPWLDGEYNPVSGHTVFGQVFEGMDVVDKIAGVKITDTKNGIPAEEVKINSIRLEIYGG